MENKTKKELAVELTVEVNDLCDSIKAKAVLPTSFCVLARPSEQTPTRQNTLKVPPTSSTSWR